MGGLRIDYQTAWVDAGELPALTIEHPDGQVVTSRNGAICTARPSDCRNGVYTATFHWPPSRTTGSVTVDWQVGYDYSWYQRRLPRGAAVAIDLLDVDGDPPRVLAQGSLLAPFDVVDVIVTSDGPLPEGSLRVDVPAGSDAERRDAVFPISLVTDEVSPLSRGTSTAPPLPSTCASGPCTASFRLVGRLVDVDRARARDATSYRVVADHDAGPIEVISVPVRPPSVSIVSQLYLTLPSPFESRTRIATTHALLLLTIPEGAPTPDDSFGPMLHLTANLPGRLPRDASVNFTARVHTGPQRSTVRREGEQERMAEFTPPQSGTIRRNGRTFVLACPQQGPCEVEVRVDAIAHVGRRARPEQFDLVLRPVLHLDVIYPTAATAPDIELRLDPPGLPTGRPTTPQPEQAP